MHHPRHILHSLTAASLSIAMLIAGVIVPGASAAPNDSADLSSSITQAITSSDDEQASDLAQTIAQTGDTTKIAVLSDTHYYPANYADDNDDFEDYVGGDPKLLEESNGVSEAAVQMIIKDHPKYVLVTGDLTKDGEQQAELDIAAKFREIETKTAEEYGKDNATKVFVINGNHDIYNTDAWNFNEGTNTREPAPLVDGNTEHTLITQEPHFQTTNSKGTAMTQGATDPQYFRYVMNDFGYGEAAEQEKSLKNGQPSHFFTNPNNTSSAPTDKTNPAHYTSAIAGELSYYVDEGNFRFVAIDSGKYSPDAGTGYDYNEHVTAGRIDESLLPWISQVTKDADKQGKTVIGFLHHGIVPHFDKEDQYLSEYVVDNWQEVASALADSGMRWVFSGHMHANDRADYVSPSGNQLTDVQTGSLASYGTPVRYVNFTRGDKLGLKDNANRHAETMALKTVSVGRDPDNPSTKVAVTYTDMNGNQQTIDDLLEYTRNNLYGKNMITNMVVGTLRPMMKKIGTQGITNYLATAMPDLDIESTVIGALKTAFATPMTITGSLYTVQVQYSNGSLEIKGIGGAATVLGKKTITNDQIMAVVNDLLNQVGKQYLSNPEYLAGWGRNGKTPGVIKTLADDLSAMKVGNDNGTDKTLVDLVSLLMTNHLAGHETEPAWMSQAETNIAGGNLIKDVINLVVERVAPEQGNGILDHITSTLTINWSLAGLSGLWLTALNAMTGNGNLKSTLDAFGFNAAKIHALVEDAINQYMSASFLTGMGGILRDIIHAMATDSPGEDDAPNTGQYVTITYTGSKDPLKDTNSHGADVGQPTQISMSLGTEGSTATTRAFRWYSRAYLDLSKSDPKTGFGLITPEGKLDICSDAKCATVTQTVTAKAQQVVMPKTLLNLGLTTSLGTDKWVKYSAEAKDLKDGTSYWYRVTSGGQTSAIYPFSTGASTDDEDTFSFINVDDSQGMTQSDYDVYHNTLKAAAENLPGSAFTVHGGDVVDYGGNEDYWNWLFDDKTGTTQSMAMNPASGNHEEKGNAVKGVTEQNPIERHYNLDGLNKPEQKSSIDTGTYYSYTYKNALFVVLNSNDLNPTTDALSDEQISWAQKTVNESKATWKILVLHKSPYSNGPHHADSDVVAIRKQLTTFCANNKIDLVLSGHDHVYNRTHYLNRDGKAVNTTTSQVNYGNTVYDMADNPDGTMYAIVGTAGVKNYVQTADPAVDSAVSMQLNVPSYAGVTIDGDKLYFRAFTVANGQSTQIDQFAISKAESAEEETAAQKVVKLINALPKATEVKATDEQAIVAAETAYNALTQTEKGEVTNYSKLVDARKVLDQIKQAASATPVKVCNANALKNALSDANTHRIQLTCDFQVESGWITNDSRKLTVNHSVTITADGTDRTINLAEFHVTNGATLTVDGTNGRVTINDIRKGGSIWTSAQPVVVEANSGLITRGSVTMQTKYGTGSDNGNAVNVAGEGAWAIIGEGSMLAGANKGLYLSNAKASAHVEGGQIASYGSATGTKSGDVGVWNAAGELTIDDGTMNAVYSTGGTVRINGGTFKDVTGMETIEAPLHVAGGAAYITGGTFAARSKVAIKADTNAAVHMLASTKGTISIDGKQPYIGSPSTKDFRSVSVPYSKLGDKQDGDGLYAASAETISGLESIAADASSAKAKVMETTLAGDGDQATMSANLPTGRTTVFGREKLTSALVPAITGAGAFWVYGPTRTLENNPVTKVVIDSSKPFVADLNSGSKFALTAHVEPDTAHDLAKKWSSSNTDIATVNEDSGTITVAKSGLTSIKVQSANYPDAASDSADLIAVKPTISGADNLDEQTETSAYTASTGIDGNVGSHALGFKWSVDNPNIATINSATGVLTKVGTGTVTITATLTVDGAVTSTKISKTVECKSLAEGWYFVEHYKKEGGVASGEDLDASKWTAPTKNGKLFAGWYTDESLKTPYKETSGKAYAKFVDADLLTVKLQTAGGRARTSDATNVRLLTAVDDLNYDQISFTVATGEGDNRRTVKGSTTTGYAYVLADGKKTLPAAVFGADTGAQWFCTMLLKNIPASKHDEPITVTPAWLTLDGTTVTGAARTFTVNEIK